MYVFILQEHIDFQLLFFKLVPVVSQFPVSPPSYAFLNRGTSWISVGVDF